MAATQGSEQSDETPESKESTGKKKFGVYSKGKNRADEILAAAQSVLIDQGYHKFSMRQVANVAGVRLANIQHYFPTKGALVEALLHYALESYLNRWESIHNTSTEPRQELIEVIESVVFDLNERRTTIFFPELWSMANHDDAADGHVDNMYARYRAVVSEIVSRINPALDPQQCNRIALFISASLEGHTMFIGHNKKWQPETAAIASMAAQSFLWLIEHGEVP